ncbi:MAG: DNA gyrase inhibitor YacG [Rhodomicrobiaceae bacterium]
MNEAGKSGGPGKSQAKVPRCPICGNPRDLDYRPFCSKRCADVDLGRWLKGDYAIPVLADDDEDGEQASVDGISETPRRNEDENGA